MLSGLGALLIVLAPVHASAQTMQTQTGTQTTAPRTAGAVRERPHPEFDPLGVRYGQFTLNATLNGGVASTDNLFASPDATAVDDMIYSMGASARLKSEWARHAMTLETGGVFTKHGDFSNEDANDYYARGSGRIEVSSATRINLSANLSHETTPRTDPDSPLVGKPVNFGRGDLTVGVQHNFARTHLSLDVADANFDYHGSQNFRDNTEIALRGRVVYDVSPALGVIGQFSTDTRDYNHTPSLRSTGQSYMIGATINSDLVRGELTVGQFRRDYKGAAGTFDGVAVSGRLDWFASEITTVTLTARRDADDQIGATTGLPFGTEEYGARVDHELLRNVILSAGVRRATHDYDQIDRTDDYTGVNLGADYILNRRVALQLRYEHDEVDSSGANAYRDFDANTVTFGVGLRL